MKLSLSRYLVKVHFWHETELLLERIVALTLEKHHHDDVI